MTGLCINEIKLAKLASVRYDSSTGKWSGIDYARDAWGNAKNCVNENMPEQYQEQIQACEKLFDPYKFGLVDFMPQASYNMCLGELANKIAADHPEL